MKIKKIIKISLLSLLSIASILFVVLVYHIINVNPIENPNIQISRIDFTTTLDSTEALDVKEKLHSIDGVKRDIIIKENRVVYYHDNNKVDAQSVYTQLMAKGNYSAAPFVLPASMATKQVCPVLKKDSFKYRFAQWVRRVFT